MNDQIAYAIAEHMQRLADAAEVSLRPRLATIDDVVTMRDRFAIALVAGDVYNPSDPDYAKDVYTIAGLLDVERKRRNAADRQTRTNIGTGDAAEGVE